MIVLDMRDGRPLYEQIIEKFELLIFSDVLKVDEPMPSVRSLAMELSINPNTIQKAYSLLESKGLIYTVAGKGSFVAKTDEQIRHKKNEILQKLKNEFLNAKKFGILKDDVEYILNEIYK